MHEATLVDCVAGVVAHGGPWLSVTSSHFNGRQTGVELNNRWESMVDDCLFYVVQWSEYDWTGVHAIDTHNIHVSNLSVGDLSGHEGDHRGIYFENCQEGVVEGNTVNGLSHAGNAAVELDESSNVTVTGNVARDAPLVAQLSDSTKRNIVVANRGFVEDEGRLNLVDLNLDSRLVWQRQDNNVPEDTSPPKMGMGSVAETYGQTFTVGEPIDMVEMRVANFFNELSAATVTLYEGDPLVDDQLVEIDSERYENWPNLERISFDFETGAGGTYYLEMSDPQGTPTWWWWEVLEDDGLSAWEGLNDVGGEALIDRRPVEEADLDRNVQAANFWITIYGV
jgi:hypothetical protein